MRYHLIRLLSCGNIKNEILFSRRGGEGADNEMLFS